MNKSKFYRNQARILMDKKWGNYAVAYLVYMLIVIAISLIPVAGSLATMVTAGAFALSFAMMTLKIVKGSGVEIGDLFKGFDNFATALLLAIRQGVFGFLWSLLFIVPGIIKFFGWSMSSYILAENPNMTAKEAMKESENLMNGHKWEYFKLNLSFFGWSLLSVLTLGILLFWLVPYMNTATGVFYTDLKYLKYGKADPYSQPQNNWNQNDFNSQNNFNQQNNWNQNNFNSQNNWSQPQENNNGYNQGVYPKNDNTNW